jgi:hypothetical protein
VGLHADEHIGEVVDGVDAVGLAGGDERAEAGQVLARLVVADEQEVLLPSAQVRSALSEALLSMGRCGSVRKSVSSFHWPIA